MNTTFNYYRVSIKYKDGDLLGKIKDRRIEHLVYAQNYTEAESVAYDFCSYFRLDVYDTPTIESINKMKSAEFANNQLLEKEDKLIAKMICLSNKSEEEETGIYAVSVKYTFTSDDGKRKKSSAEQVYIPATSTKAAVDNLKQWLKLVGETREYIISKVALDKASSVLLPTEKYEHLQQYAAL